MDNKTDLCYEDVILDASLVRQEIERKSDEDLIAVVTSIPPELKFGYSVGNVVRRFFSKGRLNVEDRKHLEHCMVLLYTKYNLEE